MGSQLIAHQGAGEQTFIHPDILGTTAGKTNSYGGFIKRLRYAPFGLEWGKTNASSGEDEIGYTGHKHDKSIGLTYMQARYYDPVIGRFYSNDPVDALGQLKRNDPVHGFNRYAYANNNPYSNTDPDGMDTLALGLEGEFFSGLGGGGQYGVFATYEDGELTIGTFSDTKTGGGQDIGASVSLQYTSGGVDDFAGTSVNGELDVLNATVEGGLTLDENGQISSDSEVIIGVELGSISPLGVGASAFTVETQVESSKTFQIFEPEEKIE